MEGPFVSLGSIVCGGVEGKSLVFKLGVARDRALCDATLAGDGGSIEGRSAGGSAAFVTDIRGLLCGFPAWEGDWFSGSIWVAWMTGEAVVR